MRACIITIGDELLQGFTVDSNSAWIGQQLITRGVAVSRKWTIGDVHDEILAAVASAFEQNYDFIFVTGGLGPTHDDVTKKAIQQYFGSDELFDAEYFEVLRARFERRGFTISENNRSQATMLSGSDPIPNPVGTALGIHYNKNQSHIFIMPGVPKEMKGMMTETIIPDYLPPVSKLQIRTLQTTGIPESKLALRLQGIMDQYADRYGFAFLPHHTGVNVRIRPMQNADSGSFEELIHAICIETGSACLGEDEAELEAIVSALLTEMGITVSVAESCTGGLIAKRLTDIAGSSAFFHGGVVAYSNELKTKLLHVPQQLLMDHGAVSAEVSAAMAEGCRTITGTDIAISTTGISGPGGGTVTKPVGLVYISVADSTGTITREFHFLKNRDMHREMTAQKALDLLRIRLLESDKDK